MEHDLKQRYKYLEEEYNCFVESFESGKCIFCEKPLKSFSAESPCLHWLLRPKRFKKKHFPLFFSNFSYFRISSYVRWIASIDVPIKNINDILEEHPGGKLIDFTAKYKHISWSFSCESSDYKGHKTKAFGNFPHYHMQIKLNGNRFICYNDFHIPFHDDDLYDFELLLKHKDFVKHTYGPGLGMQDLMGSKKGLEFIIDHSHPTEDYDNAAFKLQTLVMAKEGETISGDLIAAAIKEAKTKGKTVTSVLRDKLKDTNASMTTIVSPGDSVPKPQQRSGRKKK